MKPIFHVSFKRFASDDTGELVRQTMVDERLRMGQLPQKARLEFGQVNWVLSCSLVIVKSRSARKGAIKVEVNTQFYATPGPSGRLNLLLKPSKDESTGSGSSPRNSKISGKNQKKIRDALAYQGVSRHSEKNIAKE